MQTAPDRVLSRHTPFTSRLKGLDSEELFLKESQVRELLDHPGWEVVCELLDAAVETNRQRVEYAPRIMEQAEYASHVGLIRGLEATRGAAEAVLIQAEEARKKLREINERRSAVAA